MPSKAEISEKISKKQIYAFSQKKSCLRSSTKKSQAFLFLLVSFFSTLNQPFFFILRKIFKLLMTMLMCFGFFFFRKILISFTYLFLQSFFVLLISSTWNFRHFQSWEKIICKKLMLKNEHRHFFVLLSMFFVVYITHDFYQSLQISWNHLHYFKDNIFKHFFMKLWDFF